ncbi:MAG: flippase [Symploca sp. SIO3C6]|uniref:Flippase n=1 Tax=Symploca sp. SIO1C4 TaxID=2607765 RepID=A0A6B3N6V5_9CYAN|nr:flippase [Symploca sp. SIO3C6]NER27327.1 flippase [Symploca sp. SIO1C4]
MNDAAIKKIAKGAGTSFVGQVISSGLKYLTQVTLARLLSTELFGLYTLGVVLYRLGELFSRMGLDIGTVRYVSIYHDARDHQRLKGVLLQAIGLPFIGGTIFGIIMFLASTSIAQEVFNEPNLASIIRVFAIALPFGASMTVGASATTGFKIAKYQTYISELLLPSINLLLAILLCTLGFGLWGAAIAWLIAVIITLAVTVYLLSRIFPAIVSSNIKQILDAKELLTFSLPLSFGSFLWLVLIWTDTLILGYFQAATEVGVYRAASQTALLMALLNHSLTKIFIPTIATLYSKGEFEEVGQLFRVIARWSLSLTLPLFLIVGITSKDILHIFGTEFEMGWLLLIVLSAGQLARAGPGGLSKHMLDMSGHQHLRLYSDFALAITNIVLNILLIPKWGLMGAAVATGISIAGVNLLLVAQVYWVLGLHSYDWNYLKILGVGAAAALGGFTVQNWLPSMNYFFSLVITAASVILMYALLLLGMGLEETDKMILDKIGKRLGLFKN